MTRQLNHLWKSLRPSIVVLFVLFALNSSAQQTLIGITNHTWRYFAEVNDDPGAGWSNPSFDDSSWPLGRGLFGFDTGYPYPFVITFNGPGTGGPVASFFRTTFNWTGPISGQVFTMTNYFDDGVVVYLNGVEITRYNMPAGTADYTTAALGTLLEPVVRVHQITLDFLTNGNPNPLVSGQNVLAASVHNNTATSSDTVFGLSLVAGHVEPCSVNDLQLTNRTILEGRATTFVVSATCLPAPTVQWYRNVGQGEELIAGATGASYTLTNARVFDAGQYYAKFTNPGGTVSSRQAALVVFYDDVPPNLVSARLGPSEWEVIATVNKPLCTNFSACGTDSLFTFNWEIVNADNPMESLLISSITMNGLDVVFTLDLFTPWKLDTRYAVRAVDIGGQTGISDLYGYLMPLGSSATAPPAASAISVKSSGSALYTFDVAPNQFEFSTTVWPGTSDGAFTVADLDAAVQALDASLITLRLPEALGNPPSTFGTARYASETKNLITRPAGVIGNVILAHLRNNSGSPAGMVTLNYTLTNREPNVAEGIPGLRVYSSLSGAPHTWNPVYVSTNEDANGPKTAIVDLRFSPWPARADMYILFVDDNAPGFEVDGIYEIDNFRAFIGHIDFCDTNSPVLTRVVSRDNTTIVLTFSDPMEARAGTVAPYSVSGATVTAANINAAGMEVTLTTTPRSVGHATVTISGITDNLTFCGPNLIYPNPTTVRITTVQKVVNWNAPWQFNTNPLDNHPDWKTTGAGGWVTGNGLFGMETSAAATNAFPVPIATFISPPTSHGDMLTTYFRKIVTLPPLSPGQSYALGYYVDDGAVFYLDGVEIGRFNMPSGPVSYFTVASAELPEGMLHSLPFNASAGDHVLAVELHQTSLSNSDTVFGAQLLIVPTASPALNIVHSGTNAVVSWNADASWMLVGSTNVAGPYAPLVPTTRDSLFRPIAAPATQFYKLNYVPQP